jgi:hypothetical protein
MRRVHVSASSVRSCHTYTYPCASESQGISGLVARRVEGFVNFVSIKKKNQRRAHRPRARVHGEVAFVFAHRSANTLICLLAYTLAMARGTLESLYFSRTQRWLWLLQFGTNEQELAHVIDATWITMRLK